MPGSLSLTRSHKTGLPVLKFSTISKQNLSDTHLYHMKGRLGWWQEEMPMYFQIQSHLLTCMSYPATQGPTKTRRAFLGHRCLLIENSTCQPFKEPTDLLPRCLCKPWSGKVDQRDLPFFGSQNGAPDGFLGKYHGAFEDPMVLFSFSQWDFWGRFEDWCLPIGRWDAWKRTWLTLSFGGVTDLPKTETKLNSSLSSVPFHKPSSAQETNAVLQQSVGHPQHDAILAIVLGASLVECQSSKSPR